MRKRMLGILFVSLAGSVIVPAVRGDYLDPSAFASLGVLNLTSGDYTIETDGAPVLRDSTNAVLFTGTTYFQGGSFDDTVSVLTFTSINIASGVTIRVSGANPLALLSKSGVQLDGVINASGFDGSNSSSQGGSGTGGAGGPGGGAGGSANSGNGAGPGGGPGGPGGIGAVQAGGGGFGGKGGDSAFGTFGAPYGDLHQLLQGGSGGGATGSSLFDSFGGGGGGGGGAVELGALGSITVGSGHLLANGGLSGAAFAANAGGGSGGGLLIHAPTITTGVGSEIYALGGGFFGGGGRILFLTDDGTINQTGGNISVAPGGGANNQEPGVIEFGRLRPVPEPSSIACTLVGGVIATLGFTFRRGRSGRVEPRRGGTGDGR